MKSLLDEQIVTAKAEMAKAWASLCIYVAAWAWWVWQWRDPISKREALNNHVSRRQEDCDLGGVFRRRRVEKLGLIYHYLTIVYLLFLQVRKPRRNCLNFNELIYEFMRNDLYNQ